MDADRWKEAKRVFELVVDLTGSELDEHLTSLCAGDAELRAEVERMLEGHARRSGFLDTLTLDASRGPSPSLPETVGDVRVLSEISRGGRGVVYLGTRGEPEQLVAVKVLHRDHLRSAHHRERFRREGAAAMRLDHPNIVRVLETGEDGDVPWLVMEYIAGHDLAEELAFARSTEESGVTSEVHARLLDSGLTGLPERAARVALGVAEALAHAHEQKVIHRDIKPHNILVDEHFEPRLADFGLARDLTEVTMTREGDVEGTPHYMSPEQVWAKRAIPVDARTDIYSLGVVLYELLTRRRPFSGSTARQVMHDITTRTPTRVRKLDPAVPLDLETICHKAMEKRPQDRYQTARAMADDLQRFLELRAIVAAPPSLGRRVLRLLRKRRVPVTAAALVLGGVLSGVAWRDAQAQASELDDIEGRLALRVEQIEAGVDPTGPDDRELIELADSLCDEHDVTDAELLADLERVREHFERRCDELEERAFETFDATLAPAPRTSVDEPVFAVDATARAVLHSVQAAMYTGEAESLSERLLQLFVVRLELQLRSPDPDTPCVLTARPLDALTGARGPAELVQITQSDGTLSAALPPGRYALRLVQAGVGSAELVRDLTVPGRTHAEPAWLRADDVQSGMAYVPGGTVTHEELVELDPADGRLPMPFTVDVPSFFIDPAPVTNGEYAEFLAATGHHAPLFWRGSPRPDDWDARPVTNIALADARRYAEWRGKRLPTLHEWMLAARGATEHRFPWGDEADARLDAFDFGRPHFLQDPRFFALDAPEAAFAWYVDNVLPVGRTDEASRGPHGLDGLLGHVLEWTDTAPFDAFDGELLPMSRARYRVGAACYSSRDTLVRNGLAERIHGNVFPQLDTGFRCVRSAPDD